MCEPFDLVVTEIDSHYGESPIFIVVSWISLFSNVGQVGDEKYNNRRLKKSSNHIVKWFESSVAFITSSWKQMICFPRK